MMLDDFDQNKLLSLTQPFQHHLGTEIEHDAYPESLTFHIAVTG